MKQINFILPIILFCHTLYGQTNLSFHGKTISLIADTQPIEDLEIYVYETPLKITRFSDFSTTEPEWVIQKMLAAKVKSDMDSFIIFPEEWKHKRNSYMPLTIPFEYVDQVYDHLNAEATHKVKFVVDGKQYMMIQQKLFYKDSFVTIFSRHLVRENNLWKATLFPINWDLSTLVKTLKTEFLYDLILQKKGNELVNNLIEYGTTKPNGALNIERVLSLIESDIETYKSILINVKSLLWYEDFITTE